MLIMRILLYIGLVLLMVAALCSCTTVKVQSSAAGQDLGIEQKADRETVIDLRKEDKGVSIEASRKSKLGVGK